MFKSRKSLGESIVQKRNEKALPNSRESSSNKENIVKSKGFLSKVFDSKKINVDWLKTKQLFSRKNRATQKQNCIANTTLSNDIAYDEVERWLGHDLHSLTSFEARPPVASKNEKARELMHEICNQEIDKIFGDLYKLRSKPNLGHHVTVTSQDLGSEYLDFAYENDASIRSRKLPVSCRRALSFSQSGPRFRTFDQSEPRTFNRSEPRALVLNQSGSRTFNQSGHKDQASSEPIYMENIAINDELFQEPAFNQSEPRSITFNQSGNGFREDVEPIYMENVVISDDLFQDPETSEPIYMQNIVISDVLFIEPSRFNFEEDNAPPTQSNNHGFEIDGSSAVDIYGIYNQATSVDIFGRNKFEEDIYGEISFKVARSSTPIKEFSEIFV